MLVTGVYEAKPIASMVLMRCREVIGPEQHQPFESTRTSEPPDEEATYHTRTEIYEMAA